MSMKVDERFRCALYVWREAPSVLRSQSINSRELLGCIMLHCNADAANSD